MNRMLPLENSAILLTCIKLPFVIKICVLSIFEWPLKTGFTVVLDSLTFGNRDVTFRFFAQYSNLPYCTV